MSRDKFEEIADWGDRKYFKRDFGTTILSNDEDEKEVPLVLVAEIQDYYEATGEDEFEEKPFGISISIMPDFDLIDEAHKESVAESNSIDNEEVTLVDIQGYMGGVPVLLSDLEKTFTDMDEAEEFLMSEELRKQLNAKQVMIGFYLDGAINRIGNTRWSMIEYLVDKKKDFFKQ